MELVKLLKYNENKEPDLELKFTTQTIKAEEQEIENIIKRKDRA